MCRTKDDNTPTEPSAHTSFVTSNGISYTIAEIAENLRRTGVFADFRSRDRSVYAPLRILSSDDIKRLMDHEEICTAFSAYTSAETISDWAAVLSDETLDLMRALGEASKALTNPLIFTDDHKLGEAMGEAVSQLHERLFRACPEAVNERRALTMLTARRNPYDPRDPTFTSLIDYTTQRARDFVDDLNRIQTEKHYCLAGFNIAFCQLYTLVKCHKVVSALREREVAEAGSSASMGAVAGASAGTSADCAPPQLM